MYSMTHKTCNGNSNVRECGLKYKSDISAFFLKREVLNGTNKAVWLCTRWHQGKIYLRNPCGSVSLKIERFMT